MKHKIEIDSSAYDILAEKMKDWTDMQEELAREINQTKFNLAMVNIRRFSIGLAAAAGNVDADGFSHICNTLRKEIDEAEYYYKLLKLKL